MDKTIWQVAAGDGSRDYAEVFLKFGVILVGPGSDGEFFDHPEIYKNQDHDSYRDFTIALAEEMSKGDIVVLKRPYGKKWEIIAIGEVTSSYSHEQVFCDVDGWELQHCRQVKWKTTDEEIIVTGLRRGTLCRVQKSTAIEKINVLWPQWAFIESSAIPKLPEKMSVDELIDSLIAHGMPIRNAEDIADTLWKIKRVAKWYMGHGQDVGEHEIRTFLIIPLLLSLGWAEQKIKIEWNNIDISLFSNVYNPESEPKIIIESKRLWHGLRYAPEQAKGYAMKYPTVSKFVVTDGIRYKLYERANDSWIFTGYINLLELFIKHPYENDVKGSKEFLLNMLP